MAASAPRVVSLTSDYKIEALKKGAETDGKKQEEVQPRLERPILTRGRWVSNHSHTQSYTGSAVRANPPCPLVFDSIILVFRSDVNEIYTCKSLLSFNKYFTIGLLPSLLWYAADSILLRLCTQGSSGRVCFGHKLWSNPLQSWLLTHSLRWEPNGSRRAALSSANLFAKQMKSSGCTIRLRSFKLIISQSGNY